MKKFYLMLTAVLALSLASYAGNNAKDQEKAKTETEVRVDDGIYKAAMKALKHKDAKAYVEVLKAIEEEEIMLTEEQQMKLDKALEKALKNEKFAEELEEEIIKYFYFME